MPFQSYSFFFKYAILFIAYLINVPPLHGTLCHLKPKVKKKMNLGELDVDI